jgi:hypothetical protein
MDTYLFSIKEESIFEKQHVASRLNVAELVKGNSIHLFIRRLFENYNE